MNGYAYLYDTSSAYNVPTSHMTGHVSHMGLDIAKGDSSANVHAALIFIFGLGSAISGLFSYNPDEKACIRYGVLMSFAWICYVVAWACMESAARGGGFLYHHELSFVGVYLCALSLGFQNGMMTLYSGQGYRVTHHTGSLTDSSIILARTLMNGVFVDSKKIFILCPPFVAYFLGSMLSYPACVDKDTGVCHHDCLWIPIVMVMVVCVMFSLKVYTRKMSRFALPAATPTTTTAPVPAPTPAPAPTPKFSEMNRAQQDTMRDLNASAQFSAAPPATASPSPPEDDEDEPAPVPSDVKLSIQNEPLIPNEAVPVFAPAPPPEDDEDVNTTGIETFKDETTEDA